MTTKKRAKDMDDTDADQAPSGGSPFQVHGFHPTELDVCHAVGLGALLSNARFAAGEPPLTTLLVNESGAALAELAASIRAPGLPDELDEETIARLVEEAEDGIPEEKLQRRGRPTIGADAASTYSVRLPDDLVKLVDEKAAMEDRTRSELIREALIGYLTR